MISRRPVIFRRHVPRRPVAPRLTRTVVAALIALVPFLWAGPASADERSSLAPDELRSIAGQAAAWLATTAVEPDGAIRTPTGELDGATTAYAVLAMKASGLDQEAENPTRWLEQNIDVVAKSDGQDTAAGLAVLILVARAQNLPAEAFGNEDLVGRLLATRGPDGLFGGDQEVPVDPLGGIPSRQGLVLSALGSVGRTDAQAAEWLEERECPDGGWGFRRTDPSAPCSATAQVTGYALQGLAAVGRRVPDDAIPALHRLQDPDGGFWSYPGNTDSAATAIALQGLIASGEDPNSDRWRQGTGPDAATPFTALTRFTTPPGGFSLFPGAEPEVALTARVAIAAAGQPLPLNPTVSTDTGDSQAGTDSTTAAPNSGDSFSVLPLLGLMLVAAAVVGAIYAYRRKQQAL